jgi:hypothetical protein
MLVQICGKVVPSKGRLPVSSSNSTTPSDQMSARMSTLPAARSCSGGAECEEEILGLEVAVNDTGQMRFGERLAGLKQVIDGVARGQRPTLHQAPEIAPREVLHHHVGLAGGERSDVVDSDDVLGLDARGQTPLAHESFDEARALQGRREQVLDRNALLELEVPCGDHHAEPPFADDSLDDVLAGDDTSHRESSGHRGIRWQRGRVP